MKRNKEILSFVPNACTLMNAVCGIIALMITVYYRTQEVIYISCLLIAIGVFFDSIDGRLARRLKISSQLGKELDSFADLITFVITPMCIFLTLHSVGNRIEVSVLEILIAAFYVVCGVYRLARYNVSDHLTYFVGLPTTSAGILMSLYIFFSNHFSQAWANSQIYSICSFAFIIIIGIAMVSNVKVKRP